MELMEPMEPAEPIGWLRGLVGEECSSLDFLHFGAYLSVPGGVVGEYCLWFGLSDAPHVLSLLLSLFLSLELL